MALLDEIVSVPRRTLTLFLLIDTSACMEGNKIGAVNDAVVNVLPMLDEISQTNPDAEIKVAALEFSDKIRWMYDKPLPVSEFVWQDISAGGSSFLGNAFLELNKKLSRKSYMLEPEGSFAPMILLLSASTPEDNYNSALLELKDNKWFNLAIKVAIAIGDEADVSALKEFTGSSEAVFTVHNIEALKKTIRVVAVTYSQIGSNSIIRLSNSHEELNSCSKMKLQEALIQAISVFGKDVLIESRLLNILNDYHGFDELPSARVILKTLQNEGIMCQIIDDNLGETRISHISSRLNRNFGYDVALVEQIINDLNLALLSHLLNLKTKVTEEDLENAWTDEYGVKYSKDRLRLLKAPNSLKEYSIIHGTRIICDNAFKSDWVTGSLISISLPQSVLKIGDSAFHGCGGLQTILLPEGLLCIGNSAFSSCGFCSISLPKSLLSMGTNPFDNCDNLINVTSLSPHFSVYENAIYNQDKTKLICGFGKESKVSLPEGLTQINDWAFSCNTTLCLVSLPEGVSHIGNCAFMYCGIESLSFPHSLSYIGEGAFHGCSQLQTISFSIGLTDICDSAFSHCKSLQLVSLPIGLKHIGDLAFAFCSSLLSLSLPEGLTHIGPSAFTLCESLSNVILPTSLTQIEAQTFYGCVSLISVSLPPKLNYIDDGAFGFCKSLKSISLPETISHLGFGAFEGCELLESIIIPSGVKRIENQTFNRCQSLRSIVLPEGLSHIGNFAFSECILLHAISLSDEVTYIGDCSFSRCTSLETLYLPPRIKNIGSHAFEGCTSLCSIEFRNKVQIEMNAFDGCISLSEIIVNECDVDYYKHIFPKFKEIIIPISPSHISCIEEVSASGLNTNN